MPDVIVELPVQTSPETAYELVSDVTRMGEWSPETRSCRWLDGGTGPSVGARFRGRNRKGWRRWSTTCTVLLAEPGSRFSFEVKLGPLPMARWDYEFIAQGEDCTVRESWTEQRPTWLHRIDPTVMGIPDRSVHNRGNMQTTLANLARYVDTHLPRS